MGEGWDCVSQWEMIGLTHFLDVLPIGRDGIRGRILRKQEEGGGPERGGSAGSKEGTAAPQPGGARNLFTHQFAAHTSTQGGPDPSWTLSARLCQVSTNLLAAGLWGGLERLGR